VVKAVKHSKKTWNSRRLSLTLRYRVGNQQPDAISFESNVPEPRFTDELAIDVFDDECYDTERDTYMPTGKTQLHLSGSPRAYRAFARYLLTLSAFATDPSVIDEEYHTHLDDIRDSRGRIAVHLIIHQPEVARSATQRR
jgi:hypothetical protein